LTTLAVSILFTLASPSYSHFMPEQFRTDHLKPRNHNILRSHTAFW